MINVGPKVSSPAIRHIIEKQMKIDAKYIPQKNVYRKVVILDKNRRKKNLYARVHIDC